MSRATAQRPPLSLQAIAISLLLAAWVPFASHAASDAPSLDDLEKQIREKKAANAEHQERQRQEQAARAQREAEEEANRQQIAAALARPLTCRQGASSEHKELAFSGPVSYLRAKDGAGLQSEYRLKWGIANKRNGGFSGSLRVSVYAMNDPYTAQQNAFGTEVVTFVPSFKGTGAASPTQLKSGFAAGDIQSTAQGRNPATGKYCLVAFLMEYDATRCRLTDHYCMVDWMQFPGVIFFQ